MEAERCLGPEKLPHEAPCRLLHTMRLDLLCTYLDAAADGAEQGALLIRNGRRQGRKRGVSQPTLLLLLLRPLGGDRHPLLELKRRLKG